MIPVSTTTAYQDLLQNQRWDAVFWYDSPLELLGSLRTLQQFSLLTPFIVITEQAQTAFDAVRLGAAAASKAVLVAVLERELLHREEKEALSGYMGELSSLYRATSILFANLTSSTLDEVAHQIVDAVVRAFGRVECGVLLFDDTGSLTCAACTPSYHDEGPVLEAVKTGQVIYLPGTEQLASELILPMETAQGLVGVLDLQSRNHFEEQDRRALYSFAVRAAMAVENVRLYEAVKAYTLVLERRV
ncbi:MAG: GAF domain-containing protein, partial [Anaerolineae bacterium]|nr:GAF domain-containing protein [Anaerolineae bacterium]